MKISQRAAHLVRHSLRLTCLTYAVMSCVALADELPVPLTLEHVSRLAAEQRPEVVAAAERAAALDQRPATVGSLEDPMISASLDHYPFDMMNEGESGRRYDWSATIEQRFPLSGVLGHRRRAARAAADFSRADVERTRLDMILQAQQAFLMLLERRRMAEVLIRQHELARQVVSSATARYSAGTGTQSDLLRAEAEVARILAAERALEARTRAAEAMLNAAIGRSAAGDVPRLEHDFATGEPAALLELTRTALRTRPELRAGGAEVERAAAEVAVMRSMYRPMAMVRAGRASTMAEGDGAMLMVGISVPIWRTRLAAGVNEARAMERMALADLQGMQLMIEAETAAAREELIAALASLDALRTEVVPRVDAAVESATAAYAAGRGTLLAVIEAARMSWDTRSELVMAEIEVAQARVRLDRATGATDSTP